MKKLLFMFIIFLFSITSSYAVFFIDAKGDYISTGDYKPVTGAGVGIGFSISDDVNFLIRGSGAQNTENKGTTSEMKYQYVSGTGGIEYIPSISILEEYRIYWKNSLNFGVSLFDLDIKSSTSGKKSEMGFIASGWTGLQYNFTQTIAPFFDMGYQKSFFSSSGNSISIGGWQLALGVRFYICGSRDYESGY